MNSTDIQWSAILSWGYADNVLRLKSKQSEPPVNFIQSSQQYQVKQPVQHFIVTAYQASHRSQTTAAPLNILQVVLLRNCARFCSPSASLWGGSS